MTTTSPPVVVVLISGFGDPSRRWVSLAQAQSPSVAHRLCAKATEQPMMRSGAGVAVRSWTSAPALESRWPLPAPAAFDPHDVASKTQAGPHCGPTPFSSNGPGVTISSAVVLQQPIDL
jgi:hypothetical protein